MTIKADNVKVAIQISKYSMDELESNIVEAGFRIVALAEYAVDQIVWKPPHEGFKNVYKDPALPVFYTAMLQKA